MKHSLRKMRNSGVEHLLQVDFDDVDNTVQIVNQFEDREELLQENVGNI
jgi:hypothetical protein